MQRFAGRTVAGRHGQPLIEAGDEIVRSAKRGPGLLLTLSKSDGTRKRVWVTIAEYEACGRIECDARDATRKTDAYGKAAVGVDAQTPKRWSLWRFLFG